MSDIEAAGRLLMAAFLAGLLGWEREAKSRPAGLRTHILVALGAAGFTVVSCKLMGTLYTAQPSTSFDPLKIVAGIVGGVGFLGAGAVIQSRGKIRGLTTAANIWVVSSIGIASGMGYYFIAITLAGLAALALVGLAAVEYRRSPKGEDDTDHGS